MNKILPIIELKKIFSYEKIDDLSYVDGIRAKLSNVFLMFLSFLLVPALIGLVYRGIDVGWESVQLLTLVILVLWWGVAVARKRLSHRIRSIAAIACMYFGSTSGLLSLGLLSMAIPGYIGCSILAAIFLGVDKSLYVMAICLLSILSVGFGITSGALQIPVDAEVFNTSTGSWTAAAIFFTVIVGSLVLCFAGLMGALLTLISKVREQGAELMLRHDQLEELVADRTLELTKEIEVRKERELALTASEERFKGFTEVVSDRYWETDENFVITYAPPTFQATLEFGVNVIGEKPWEIDLVLLDNDKERLRSTLESKKEFRDLKICWRMPNGQKIFRRLSGTPMRDAMGKFKGFRVVGVDETAEVVAQEETQAIQTRFFDALNQFNIGVVLWDLQEKIQYCNKAMKWLYPQWRDLLEVGLARATLREASWKYRAEIGDTSKSKDEWFEESRFGNFVDTIRRPDGGVSKRYRRVLNGGWEIAIHIDASEEGHREWAIAEAKSQVDAANLAKNNLLRSISYELRTPINAILGFGKLLHRNKDNNLSEKQSNYIDGVKVSGERLLDLVGGILELSHVENGEFSLQLEEFDCLEDVRNCIQGVEQRATVKDIKIVENLLSVERSTIQADKELFKITFNRLLLNAIDSSQVGGQIGISIEKLSDGFIRLKVSDTGQGNHRNDNFNQFTSFGYFGQELTGEVGVEASLYICKRHIEQMNGRINFERGEGAGGTTWIDMPIPTGAEKPSQEAPQGA